MSGKWHCGYLDGTGITLKSNEKPLNTLEKRYQGRLPFAIVHSSFFVIFHLRFSTFCVENTVVFHIFDVLCGILHGKSIICDFSTPPVAFRRFAAKRHACWGFLLSSSEEGRKQQADPWNERALLFRKEKPPLHDGYTYICKVKCMYKQRLEFHSPTFANAEGHPDKGCMQPVEP